MIRCYIGLITNIIFSNDKDIRINVKVICSEREYYTSIIYSLKFGPEHLYDLFDEFNISDYNPSNLIGKQIGFYYDEEYKEVLDIFSFGKRSINDEIIPIPDRCDSTDA